MNPFNEQEFNRLCAEFLGWEQGEDGRYWKETPTESSNWYVNEMYFHSDWNWIMEVVRKIISLRNRSNLFKEVYGEVYRFQHTCLDDIIDINILASKIWQFINWYNEKNKQYVYN